ncbi:MAG: hypothetical protein U0X93_02695 [Anaerolineales bacterium]
MIDELLRNFSLRLTSELSTHAFEQQGLTVYEAVIVASIVEREAVQDEEAADRIGLFESLEHRHETRRRPDDSVRLDLISQMEHGGRIR